MELCPVGFRSDTLAFQLWHMLKHRCPQPMFTLHISVHPPWGTSSKSLAVLTTVGVPWCEHFKTISSSYICFFSIISNTFSQIFSYFLTVSEFWSTPFYCFRDASLKHLAFPKMKRPYRALDNATQTRLLIFKNPILLLALFLTRERITMSFSSPW